MCLFDTIGLIKYLMAIKRWVEVSREPVIEKYGRKVDKVIFKLQNGSKSDFYIADQNNRYAVVLALTFDNKVILVKQFRPGPQKVLLDLPGGAVDKSETPLDAIKRELLEESGYAGDFQFITESVFNAYSGAVCYHFIARNCRKIQEIINDETEFTEDKLIKLTDFRKQLRSGQVCDFGTAYLGLDYLHLL